MLDVGHQEISKTNSKRWLEVRVRLQRLGARNLKLQNLSQRLGVIILDRFFSRPTPHVKVLRDLEIMSNLRQLSFISPSNDASYSLHIIAPSGTKKKHPSCMVGCCLFYETMTKFRRQLAAHHVKPSTPRKSMTFGKLSPDKSRMTQFELAFELAPEQFELDFDLAAAASNSNSNSPPPRREKKNKPFRVCIHGQALKDCELSAGKSGARS